MPRIRFAVAVATAMIALCPAPSRADTALRLDPAPERREAQHLHAIVDELEDWLDRQTDWPRRGAASREATGGGACAGSTIRTAPRSCWSDRGIRAMPAM